MTWSLDETDGPKPLGVVSSYNIMCRCEFYPLHEMECTSQNTLILFFQNWFFMNNHVILIPIPLLGMIIWDDYLGYFYLLTFSENLLAERHLSAVVCSLSSELKDGIKVRLRFLRALPFCSMITILWWKSSLYARFTDKCKTQIPFQSQCLNNQG